MPRRSQGQIGGGVWLVPVAGSVELATVGDDVVLTIGDPSGEHSDRVALSSAELRSVLIPSRAER